MTKLPSSLQKLINELSKLPGIGPKTAQRLAFYLLKEDNIDLNNLSESISKVKEGIVFCSTCHNMGENDPCFTCTDPKRDHSIICVVEEPLDAQAIDKSGQFNGVFGSGIVNSANKAISE
jgi:recombination protein RecR